MGGHMPGRFMMWHAMRELSLVVSCIIIQEDKYREAFGEREFPRIWMYLSTIQYKNLTPYSFVDDKLKWLGLDWLWFFRTNSRVKSLLSIQYQNVFPIRFVVISSQITSSLLILGLCSSIQYQINHKKMFHIAYYF